MAFSHRYLAVMLLSLLAHHLHAEGAEETPVANKSPYFIDALHCEGLAAANTDEDRFRDKAAAAIGTRALKQKYCEEVFDSYGLRKFEWRTAEDLEMLAYAIKNSNRYEGFELSIQKSQLQNHVHVFGEFTEFRSQTHFNASALARYEGSRGKGEPRRIFDVTASVEFQRRGPANPPSGILSVRSFESRTKNALTAEDIDDKKSGTLILNPEDQLALAKRNSNLQAINYRAFLKRTSSSRAFADLGLINHRLSGDETDVSDQRAELGYSLDSDETELFIGSTVTTWTGSLVYSTYSALPSETILRNTFNDHRRDVVFAGIKQDTRSHTLEFSWSYYRSITPAVRYFGDVNLIWTFAETGRFAHSLGFLNSIIQRPVLPEHRFSLNSQVAGEIFYRIGANLPVSNGDHRLELKMGAEHVRYDGERENNDDATEDGVSLATPFFALDYTLKLETIEARLGVVYATHRSR